MSLWYYTLLQEFSLNEMLNQFKKKYSNDEVYMTIKSLLYFEDADQDADIVCVGDQIDWQTVKAFIKEEVKKIA